MTKVNKLGVTALLSAALVLAPLATASANFMSMSDEDMERYQSMFRTNVVNDESNDPIRDDELGGGDGSPDEDGNVSNPGEGNNPNPVPEPGMLALFGIGALGLALMVRRRSQVVTSD